MESVESINCRKHSLVSGAHFRSDVNQLWCMYGSVYRLHATLIKRLHVYNVDLWFNGCRAAAGLYEDLELYRYRIVSVAHSQPHAPPCWQWLYSAAASHYTYMAVIKNFKNFSAKIF